MKRRFSAVCSGISVALLVTSLCFWVRSYRVCDLWTVGNVGEHHFSWTFDDRAHPMRSYPPRTPDGATSQTLSGFGVLSFRQSYLVPGARRHAPRAFRWDTHDNMFPSLGVSYFEPGDMLNRGWWIYREVSICYWSLVVFFAVVPVAFLVRTRRGSTGTARASERTEAGRGHCIQHHA